MSDTIAQQVAITDSRRMRLMWRCVGKLAATSKPHE